MNILITGSAGGIARKLIEELKSSCVIYAAVHTEKQRQLAVQRYQNDPHIHVLKLDVTSKEDYKQIDSLEIDIFVANAALGMGGSIAEMDIDLVRSNFEVNVFGNFSVLQVVLRKMIKRGKGRVIILSSLAAKIPIPFLGSYCATKASINKFAETLRLELGLLPVKIPIILIEPGLYATGFNQVMFDNKYTWMEKGSYFHQELALIRKSENLLLAVAEKHKLNSIVKQIKKAIFLKMPKKVYSAPYLQKILVKIYTVFLER